MYCYLNVINFEKNYFSGFISKIQVFGCMGELTIYPGHSELLTILKSGLLLIFDKKGNKEYIYISGGILEVHPKLITILSDITIKGVDLDKELILNEKKKYEKIIKENNLKKNDKNKNLFLQLEYSLSKLKVIKIMDESS